MHYILKKNNLSCRKTKLIHIEDFYSFVLVVLLGFVYKQPVKITGGIKK